MRRCSERANRLEWMMTRYSKLLAVVALASLGLAGCSSYAPFLPSAGASAQQIIDSPANVDLGIQVVDLSDTVVRRVIAAQHRASFAETFGTGNRPKFAIGEGDSLEVSVWEAPPAALFGG